MLYILNYLTITLYNIQYGNKYVAFSFSFFYNLKVSIAKGQLFTTVGVCKGNTVAIRRLKLKTIELNRPLLLEFQQVIMFSIFKGNCSLFIYKTIHISGQMHASIGCCNGSIQTVNVLILTNTDSLSISAVLIPPFLLKLLYRSYA